jgi:hypothetical protein
MEPIQKAKELIQYYKGNKEGVMNDINETLTHYSKMISKFPTDNSVKDGMKYWIDVKKQVLNY